MKLDLRLSRDGTALLAHVYDVTDADSFANACADLWWKLERHTASAGEDAAPHVLDRLAGAQLSVLRL